MHKHLLFLLLLLCSCGIGAQPKTLSDTFEISVLTCGPGEELYATFGHNSFRVRDKKRNIDIVYNYGTFDFNTPNFYVKFSRGKLPYRLSRQHFDRFLASYQYENRWVKEQVLDLTLEEKQQLITFLENNALPENREYAYDFFFDNCATRIYDVIKTNMNGVNIKGEDFDGNPPTFREILHDYLSSNSWNKFGIDLALGSVIDRKTSLKDRMFLPDYVYDALDSSTIERNRQTIPIVKSERLLNSEVKTEGSKFSFLTSPMMVFGVLLLLVLFFTYRDLKKGTRSRWLDVSLFIITGLVGTLIFLLWFATDHTATAKNFNLLWAVPTNLIVSFYISKVVVKPWVKKYLWALVIGLLLIPVFWVAGVQIFDPAIILIALALGTRYAHLLIKH